MSSEGEQVAKRMKRAGAELHQLIAIQLIAVDVKRCGVDEQLVIRVRGEKLPGRDDRVAAVVGIEAHIERNGGTERETGLQAGLIHRARQVEAQLCGWVDPGVPVAGCRTRKAWRAFGDEGPEMWQGI